MTRETPGAGPPNTITGATVNEVFLRRIELTPDQVAYRFRARAGGPWESRTFRQFHAEVETYAHALAQLGIRVGDRVGLYSGTRYEWTVLDFAILGAGAVTVPVYPSLLGPEARRILAHAEARAVVVEGAVQLERLLGELGRDPGAAPRLEWIIVLDARALTLVVAPPQSSAPGPLPTEAARASRAQVLALPALRELATRARARDPGAVRRRLEAARPEDTLTLCYTSGTTGDPKGATLTQACFASVLNDAVGAFGRFVHPRGEVTVSYLPYAHVLGKTESLLIHALGWETWFAEGPDRLLEVLAEARPTLIFAVPRVFEKAYARVQAAVAELPGGRRRLFDRALAAAARARDRGGVLRRARAEALGALAFRRVRARFGGRLRHVICGGAPLTPEIGRFFELLGIRICEGYGLTETSGPITLNPPDDLRFGTVGRPLPDVEIRVAPDGEILVRSAKVFAGYHRDAGATAEVLREGWLHTGDIGALDADGYLRITDRKKEILVTASGKNVAPQKLENLAKRHPWVSQCVVIGDRRPFLVALLVLDRDQTVAWARSQEILFSDYSDLVRHPRLIAEAQTWMDTLNRELPSFETIKRFALLPRELTLESGELTPSLKLRRAAILRNHAQVIDALYA